MTLSWLQRTSLSLISSISEQRHLDQMQRELGWVKTTWYFGGVNYLINNGLKKVLNRLEIQAALLRGKMHFFLIGVLTLKSSTVNCRSWRHNLSSQGEFLCLLLRVQRIITLTDAHNSLDCKWLLPISISRLQGTNSNWKIKKEWKLRTSQKCFFKRKPAILNLLEISEYNCEKRDTITWTSKKK